MFRLDSFFMDRPQFNAALAERVLPLLEELGVEGCVIAGYAADGDGKLHRFVSGTTNRNPAIEDALSKWTFALSMWAAPAQEFGPPSEQPKS